jgi:UDP-N-acetylenolpyruvoylglucosamine reductase
VAQAAQVRVAAEAAQRPYGISDMIGACETMNAGTQGEICADNLEECKSLHVLGLLVHPQASHSTSGIPLLFL